MSLPLSEALEDTASMESIRKQEITLEDILITSIATTLFSRHQDSGTRIAL